MSPVRRGELALSLSCVLASALYGQSKVVDLHGTVNVLLTNPHGVVLVTDSRLSNGNRPVGEGKKLFLVDDHTICSIAGWFSSSGPSMDQRNFPLATAIPSVVQSVTRRQQGTSGLRLEDKVELLVSAISFTLESLNSVNRDLGQPNLAGSELIAATVENGRRRFVQVKIVPMLIDGRVRYRPSVPIRVQEPSDELTLLTGGIGLAIQRVLASQVAHVGEGFILPYLLDSLKKDKGASLTLEEMQQIARALEGITAKDYPSVVGGKVQIATIADGKATLLSSYEQEIPDPPLKYVLLTEGNSIENSETALLIGGPQVAIVSSTRMVGIRRQPLDHLIMTGSTLDRFGLVYNGSYNFYLDTSNVITNSTLRLGLGVSPVDPVVRRLLYDFPGLRLVD